MITEFYCDQCHGYNIVDLADDINGLHIIICGKCKHEHYRCIDNGIISNNRYDKRILENIKIKAFTYVGKWKERPYIKNLFLDELWVNLTAA